MKRLKKKHRPMTFREWMDSTGGQVFASTELGDDYAKLERLAEFIQTDEAQEAQEAGQRALAAYHVYICLHIQHLLDQ